MTRKEELEKTIDFDDAINRIVRLEKENAELRKIAQFQQSSNMDRGFQLQRSNEELTKAKEIINNCVHELQNILLHKIRNKERIASILERAEQFLKEVDHD